jgi:hypothetical protein
VSGEKRINVERPLRLALWIAAGIVVALIALDVTRGGRLVELVSPPAPTPVPTRPKEPRDGGSGHPYCGDLHADVDDGRIIFGEDDHCSYRLVDLDETDDFTAMIIRAKHLMTFSKAVELFDCTSSLGEGYLESEYSHLYYTDEGDFITCGVAW